MASTVARIKDSPLLVGPYKRKCPPSLGSYGGRRWSRGDSNPGPEKMKYGSSTCLVVL